MKRVEGLPRTPYIMQCCKTLEDANEHESDLVLVTVIRLYGFVEQSINWVTNRLVANEVNAPIWMQSASLRGELNTYWSSVPDNLKNNCE
jgi:hypothetical protein